MRFERFKKNKWCKVICYLVLFAFMLEIPMPAYAANTGNSAIVQSGSEENAAAAGADSGTAVKSAETTENTDATSSITDGSPTASNDAAKTTNNLQNLLNGGMDGGGLNADTILGSAGSATAEDGNAALVPTTEKEIVTELPELREPNVKYFRNTDGTDTAYVYDHVVHYLADDGTYQEIDNSLKQTETSGGKEILTNRESDTDFTLAQDASEGNMVSINKEGYNLKWRLLSAEESEAKDTTDTASNLMNTLAPTEDPTSVEDSIASAQYDDILKNVDVEYVLVGTELKENITLNSANVPSQFSFVLTTSSFLFAKESEGQIYFENADGETVFHMSEAMMYDAKGAESTDITVKLAVISETEDSHQYKLTITPSAAWLKEEARVYPVVLDPTITTLQTSSMISDTHVNSDYPNSNNAASASRIVGTMTGGKSSRTYIKFNLPSEIQKSDRIVSATFSLHSNTENVNSIFYDYATTGPYMYLQTPKADWNESTLTWSNQPDFNSNVVDYSKVDIVSGSGGTIARRGWYDWDVTSVVDGWYNGAPNYGVMIRDGEVTQHAKRAYFHSTNDVDYADRYPMIAISYVNMIGLEDYWTYHTQSAGLAGSGYVNDFTGGLTASFNDYSWDSEILSLGVSHVYNSDNYNKAQTSLDVGYGYMLSLQESITPVTINGISLYKYVDGDGTQHYFQYSDNKWSDDSGLGLTLTINNTDSTYVVTDKSDNTRTFYQSTGYLKEIKDNDGNKITLSYSSDNKYLEQADDSAGHRLTFNRDDNHHLKCITVKETAHDNVILAQIDYTYDSGGHLTQVKFPGKSTVSSGGSSGSENIAQFGYTGGGTLNKLTDTTNGMSVDYTYDYYGSNTRPRVTTFNVYNSGGGLDSSYSMTYSSHCTRFTETQPNLGRSQVYVFNYMGQTVSAQDQDGNALFCETGLAGGAKNKVTFASKAQQSITNLIKNHDFESGMTGYNSVPSTANCSIVTSNVFYGSNCLKVVSDSSSPSITGKYQSVTVTGGKLYTLSAYVKTSGCSTNGADLKLEALSGSTVMATAETDKIVSESGYLRFDTTIDLTSLSSSQTYTLKAYFGLKNVAGTAYFDAVQLEKGGCANRYNLMENSNFESGISSWSAVDNVGGTISTEEYLPGGSQSLGFWGSANTSQKEYQTIPVSGQSGDSYVFGCWVKSNGLPNKDTGDGSKQCLGMTLEFQNAAGQKSWKSVLITPTSSEWQYICASAVAPWDYTGVTIYLKYVYNCNKTWFDDVQLYKDSFGDSFTYDSKGNVISVVDKANNTASAATNGNNDTTSYSDGKGQTYNFVYNGDNNSGSTKHNLTQSTAPDGTSSSFVYDDFGNVTRTDQHSKWDVVSRTITNTVSYTGNGAYKASSTDPRNLTTTYNYDQRYGLLTSTTIPVGSSSDTLTTANTYDTATRKVTQINAIINTTDFGTALNYSYAQNRPGSIQIGNAAAYLKYGYAYDNTGNMTSVTRSSSGNTTPVTMESYGYIAGRGLKSSQTYGNGQTLNYTYDSQDRLVGVSNGSLKIGKYAYDGNGLLGKALSYDSAGNLTNTTTNQYDLADRLISSANSKGSGIYNVGYDKNNLATGYNSYLRDGSANLEYTIQYAYNEFPNSDDSTGVDKPKTDSLKIGSTTLSSTSFSYDYFGRNTSRLASAGDTSVSHIKVGYAYLDVGTNQTTTMPARMAVRYTTVPNSSEAPDYAYNLSYDRSGNITNILTEVKNSSSYTKTYGYDALSRLTAAGNVANSGDNYAYTYDGRNNITGSTVTNNGATTQTKSYTYATDDIDRLASFSHSTAAGTVTRNYTCDSIGNPTAITETNSADNSTRNVALTWTQGKLLNSVSDNAGLSNTYTYDADGNVAKKVVADGSYVVYHYSDGSLEYEEHFNATGTLQEVLKYSYDADGNVEYLLYKNDNFSTATAYDLYYYVRNATGDVTDLFQVREQSGSGTTVVNRLAAHYEYDPYGNILSINKYNNDPIGDINPIRYKDYYYDLQTGWYQLGSRFYDSEVGRFLNADDVSLLMNTDSGVVDKNLYAYCDGNPVMRKDDGGDCWIAGAVFGAAFGAAFEIADQMIVRGKSWKEVDKTAVLKAAAIGAVTGALGPGAGSVVSGAISGYSSYKSNNSIKKAIFDGVVSAGLSYVCGNSGKIASKISGKIKTSVPQKTYMSKPLKKWQKAAHEGIKSFHSSLSYWLYYGALYQSKKRK